MSEETKIFTAEELKEYSNVVARTEREACAKVAEEMPKNHGGQVAAMPYSIAAAIRART